MPYAWRSTWQVPVLTAADLKTLLSSHKLYLSKRRGQNYLIDPTMIRCIVESCALRKEDTVVEIGAGLGALTESLSQQAARVYAVEIDRGITKLLRQRLVAYKNVTIVEQDILQFDWEEFKDLVVVGAIPYSITSAILVALTAARSHIRQAILILQKEVAQRLLALPKTKAYGRLSLLCQYTWEATPLFDIPAEAFFPKPKVDSCGVRLTQRRQPPILLEDESLFFQLVQAAFSQRRKTLINCLKGGLFAKYPRSLLQSLFKELGLSPNIRGEALSLEEFGKLANTLAHPRLKAYSTPKD